MSNKNGWSNGLPIFLYIKRMINLNDEKYQEKLLPTEDNILKFISDYDIFKYYLPEFDLNNVTNSPFRKDNNPSFGIYLSKRYVDRILYKDLCTGETGGAITLVQNIFNLSHNKALEQIILDFDLKNKFNLKYNLNKSSNVKPTKHTVNIEDLHKDINLNIKSRKGQKWDIEYWNSYGISTNTLAKYNVKPVAYIFINGKIFKADKYSYAYTEYKDNLKKFKIYQPFSENLKWLNNFIPNTLSGYSQLPIRGNILFIASSLKDGMNLHDLGYNFIAPQTENYTFKPELIDELNARFSQLITFYDNDEAGINASKILKKDFNIPYINTGNSPFKDNSDYYYNNGRDNTIKLINNQLNGLK